MENQLKKIILATAFCTTFLSVPAFADMYIGAGAGASKTSNSQSSWKLDGGIQFNPTWGLEVAYNDLGRDHAEGVKSWSLAGTGAMPLNDSWSLLGKLGVTSNRSRSNSANHSDMLIGAGVSYAFSKKLAVHLEYEDFGKLPSDSLGHSSHAKNVGLNLKYML